MTTPCPHGPTPPAVIDVDTNPDSPWNGCVSVNRGYSGAHEFANGRYQCPTPTWRVEFVPGNTQANARRIVALADKVDAELARLGVVTARLGFAFNEDGTTTVTEYDYRRFAFTLPA